jgi:hypothetical protein
MSKFILRFALVVALFVGLLLTGLGIQALLRPVVSEVFGKEMIRSGPFYLAVVALSLIVYLLLIVLAMRIFESSKKTLQMRFPKIRH